MAISEVVLTQGTGRDFWRKTELRVPKGEGTLVTWEEIDTGLLKAILNDTAPTPKPSKRWLRAQTAEAAFWKSWRKNTLYAHVSLEAFWLEVLEKTGGKLPSGKILDIGCGPVSVLNFQRHDGIQPIGLDPLAEVYARANLIESAQGLEPIPIIGLPAEALPFADASLDHLICFNVLDHVANAPTVLAEMFRVLKPKGTIRLYVHTFQPWIKRLLFFDRPHVYHWDHPEFCKLVESAGFQITHQLKEPKTFDFPDGLWPRLKQFPYWVATKVGFTSYFSVTKPW